MKIKAILLSVLITGFLAINVHGQITVPKTKDISKQTGLNVPSEDVSKDILKALDPGKSFTSPDKLVKLLGNNKSFVGDAMKVMNGLGTDDEKLGKLNLLKKDRKDFIEKLLGESKAAKYYSLVKKKIEPLAKKYAMAKMFL